MTDTPVLIETSFANSFAIIAAAEASEIFGKIVMEHMDDELEAAQ